MLVAKIALERREESGGVLVSNVGRTIADTGPSSSSEMLRLALFAQGRN